MMASKKRILLFTQNPKLSNEVRSALDGLQVVEVRESAALGQLLNRGTSLMIIDLNLPIRALTTTSNLLSDRRELPTVILATGSASQWHQISRGNPLEEVVYSPFTPENLRDSIQGLLDKSQFLHERLVGQSEAIRELRDRILLIAPTPVTVLVSGESGVGKDVVAQALHHYSPRSRHPFKALNCGAVPENLLENELFGHEKGAFTDARSQYQGLFEQTMGGTVFLDEIGEMSLSAQVRLLRILEEREFTRIGGSATIAVDVRVIAASNKDLSQAVAVGEFRRDLYHRLKVVELQIPPLRQRREDIASLLDHFALIHSHKGSMRFSGYSDEAIALLTEYDWPGNVRELRNLVERLVFLGPGGLVEPQDLLPHLESAPSEMRQLPVATNKTPDQSERELIYFALLDLKREVSELRNIINERLGGRSPERPRPIYDVEQDYEEEIPSYHDSNFDPAKLGTQWDRVRPLKDLEREAIEVALKQVSGNRRLAAEILGIGLRTLYRKLDEYGLK